MRLPIGTFRQFPVQLLVLALLCTAATVAHAMDPGEIGDLAGDIVDASNVKGGLVVVLGCQEPDLLTSLRVNESYLVQGLETDPAKVSTARGNIREAGVHGQVTAAIYDGKLLPYVDNSVNLIIAGADTTVPSAEIMRALAPRGVAMIGGKKTVKAVPDSISDWTHSLYDAKNNAVSTDTQVGPPVGLQWVCGPRWSRHHEHMSSVSAMVSAKGRVFYIMDEGSRASIQLPPKWKLIARDAFNGTILWKRDIPTWYTHLYPLKSGPAILSKSGRPRTSAPRRRPIPPLLCRSW